ncbi:MAG: SDR family oxidoreductase [Deltaproteobacteria bacterium]|nr:SDR family oxidoreductase [Deltaproteobacteria bacterium]
MSLHDEVALVTAAGHGIGRAIAVRLARAGCRVAAIGPDEAELRETIALAGADRDAAAAQAIVADVTRDTDLEHAARLVIERLGRVTVVVNNAGFVPPPATVVKTSLADWDHTLARCLRAPMVLTRLMLPDMLAHGRGAVVNIAFTAARRGRAGQSAYAAAKFGLIGFTQSLFAEVRDHGIKVASIIADAVDTDSTESEPQIDRAKLLQPDDVADAVIGVLISPARTCATEIILEPQYDPYAS